MPVVVGGDGAVPGLAVLAAGRFDECDLDLRVTDARLADDPGVLEDLERSERRDTFRE